MRFSPVQAARISARMDGGRQEVPDRRKAWTVMSVCLSRRLGARLPLRSVVLDAIDGLEAMSREEVVTEVRVGLARDVAVNSVKFVTDSADDRGMADFRKWSGYDVETWNGMQLCLALLAYSHYLADVCSDPELLVLSPSELCDQCVRWFSKPGQCVAYQELRDLIMSLDEVSVHKGPWSSCLFLRRPEGGEASADARVVCELIERDSEEIGGI